jgi:hypothetical protein
VHAWRQITGCLKGLIFRTIDAGQLQTLRRERQPRLQEQKTTKMCGQQDFLAQSNFAYGYTERKVHEHDFAAFAAFLAVAD